MNAATPRWAIRPLTPEAVYTDRQEQIEYLYQTALKKLVLDTLEQMRYHLAIFQADRLTNCMR